MRHEDEKTPIEKNFKQFKENNAESLRKVEEKIKTQKEKHNDEMQQLQESLEKHFKK